MYRRVLAAGGLVALGTDAPLTPVGLLLHLALRAVHRSGLPAARTLRTATVLPARVFGAERDLGTLEPGRPADMTVVDGDPITDFDALVRTVPVVRGGVPYEQAYPVRQVTGPGEADRRSATMGDGLGSGRPAAAPERLLRRGPGVAARSARDAVPTGPAGAT